MNNLKKNFKRKKSYSLIQKTKMQTKQNVNKIFIMHLLHLDQWMARRKYLTLTIYISLSSLGFLLRTKLNGAGREKVQKRRN